MSISQIVEIDKLKEIVAEATELADDILIKSNDDMLIERAKKIKELIELNN